MQLRDGEALFSATDLVAFSECQHLAHLELERAHGRFAGRLTRDDVRELIARKGTEHEQRHLDRLRAAGGRVVEIATDSPAGDRRDQRVADTQSAMESGADAIYQAALASSPWRGFMDFLMRVETPSALGPWGYEVADTKLAHRAKPHFIVQLCLYSELLTEAQGAAPEHMRVILGSGVEERLRVADFAPYVRRLRRRFEKAAARGFAGTYPHPVERCDTCRFQGHCEARRETDDHLSLVAGMRRGQIDRLSEAGVATVADLAATGPRDGPVGFSAGSYAALRHQAELQVHERTTGRRRYELLEPEDGRGFELLPEPDDGDVVFDIEGDPFFDGGLEYLFGVGWLDDGRWRFAPFWARDRRQERKAFEDLVDFLDRRLARFPGMHVYHYASYETSALKRLMGLHGTREEEVDRLLREERMIDLYAVVRQALRLSSSSYSIKKVEAFYGFHRSADVGQGDDSIVVFERFLETGDEALLRQIEEYNEEDCLSTLRLLEWLRERRDEAIERFGRDTPWATLRDDEEPHEEPDPLAGDLVVGVPEEWAPDLERPHLGLPSAEVHWRWLMAQVLAYHPREAKPAWWAYFERLRMSREELIDDREALGGLARDLSWEPVAVKRSLEYRMTFPVQEHRISAGSPTDAGTGKQVKVVEVDDDVGALRMTRGAGRDNEPLPSALIPGGPINTDAQRDALRRVAAVVRDHGLDGEGLFAAARAILARRPPREPADGAGALIDGTPSPDALADLVRGLDRRGLVVQGPPGAGKTWTAARTIVQLVHGGLRVGVASTSHRAIHNLLDEIETVATAKGVPLAGLKKASASHEESRYVSRLDSPMIESSADSGDFPPADDIQLVAGTSWLFAREEMDAAVDVLVIDEAGQVSLADAVAMATAADRVILLGDPRQLAHVSQGTHPPGAAASVLDHLLGDRGTVAAEDGVFLDRTWRLHPDICQFVSDAVYEGRLTAEAGCREQAVSAPGLSGSGVRFLPIAHRGNARSSPEEADAIQREVNLLLQGRYTDRQCRTRPLRAEDVMVVAPYNAQVRQLREVLPDDVRVGTVDKFQGQSAPVVFFSLTTSSGEDVPRNLGFLLSINRLNVALSRARALAVVVASPELLDVRCRSLDDMRLASALCLLTEIAADQTAAPTGG